MPTNRERIEKWSLAYHVLKYYVDMGFRFYYNITISGISSLPKGKPIILAPNHQNALMDALAVLTLKTWQPVFLARADIFENPLASKVLTFLKILPVYRIRDGYENLHKNDHVFQKTVDVLKNGNGLVILPEGNHGDKKKLRPLKKGIARIALQAETASDVGLDISIVPVGIDYTNYIRVGSGLNIRVGEPIPVKPFVKIYSANPANAYNLLIAQLEKGIKAEMLHIEEERYHTVYLTILSVFTKEYLRQKRLPINHANSLDSQQQIVASLDRFRQHQSDDFLLIAADALEYKLLLGRRKLSIEHFGMSDDQKLLLLPIGLFLLLSLPIFLYGLIFNIFNLCIPLVASQFFSDKQFVSSVRFGLGLILTPIFYALQIVIFWSVMGNWIYTLIFAVSLPLSLYLFFKLKRVIDIALLRSREMGFRLFRSGKVKRVDELNKSLKKQMWDIINYKEEDFTSSTLMDY